MKKILTSLICAAFMVTSVPAMAASRVDQCVVKKCLFKKRCDYKAFCKKGNVVYTKRGFAFIAPVVALLPPAADIAGTAVLGVVGGAAAGVGDRVIGWLWPDRHAPKNK